VASSFAQNTAARVAALADLFPDQLEAGRAHFNALNAGLGHPAIESDLLFHGPRAYEQLAGSSAIDLIQISTPPFFHVQHLEAAVAAGKHVYCEKPVGIDVAQTRQALEIAKRVRPTQSVDVGFQCRSAPPIAAIAEKIQAGALGKIASVSAYYFAPASLEKVVPGASADEHRLRNWLWDRALSGDILVEQNIHIVDLCNWLLGAHPLKAVATGGRTILTHAGDCWDNYQVEFTYPGDRRVSFSSTQFGAYGLFEAGLRLFGAEGAATIPYAGPVQIVGAEPFSWTDSMNSTAAQGKFAANGGFEDNLAFADRDKERTFIDSIVSGPKHNQIAAGVETALSCMLGRMAGLQQREVTWDDLLAHGETYKLGMDLKQFA
jgi:predicted dehydrogenase